MPLFRFDRALLLEPYETEVEVIGREDMAAHLRSFGIVASVSDLSIAPFGYDTRLQKNVWAVIYYGGIVGYLDGPL